MSDELVKFEQVPGFRAPETMKVIRYLEDKGKCPGLQVTDEELTRLIGKDTRPGKPGYGYVRRAIGYLYDEVVWQRMPGAYAIMCLGDAQIGEHCAAEAHAIRRRSKRTIRKLHAVDVDQLSNEQRIDHHALVAQMGTVALMADKQTAKMLAVRQVSKPADRDGLMRLME